MSKSFKALSLKGQQDWATSVYCFDRNTRNNLMWSQDSAARAALKHYFQSHLTTSPTFKHSANAVRIHLYYYADPAHVNLSAYQLAPLKTFLDSIYASTGKPVHLTCTRLHYPYLNAEILAKYLALNANHHSWGQLTRKFFRNVPIAKAPLDNPVQSVTNWHHILPLISRAKMTSAIQGVKFQVSGRLSRRRGASRTQTLRKSLGTFHFTSAKSLIDSGRHTFTNRNGSITVKVWVSSAIFGAQNALRKAIRR